MIKSMTGFAALTRDDELATIGVTIKSVNHRFLDLQLRVPPSLSPLENRITSAAITYSSELKNQVRKRVGPR